MKNNEFKLLKFSRQLSPGNQEYLMMLVKTAFKAENSTRKSLGFSSISNKQEYSCKNITQRSKE
jgi:hypothetical protein